MSGVDPLLGLDRAVRGGDVRDGDLVLLLAAGTGYTWAASAVRWGPSMSAFYRADRQGARARPSGSRSTRSGSTSSREATDDPQWIHIDPVRAAEGPFGTTIAHGFLTLSLCVPLMAQALAARRLPAWASTTASTRCASRRPLPSGSRIRARFTVQSVEEVPGGEQGVVLATVEREGGDKPVCVAELVLRMIR